MPFLIRFFMFVAITLAVGLGSAWRAVNYGFFATTHHYGPWSIWLRDGTADADPYTLAHISREGVLPITSASSLTFTATQDSSGARLSGDCTYEIRGYSFPALWWDIAAFRTNGHAIQNKTGRSSFASNTIFTAPDGSFIVRLSPDVQPGNWLPSDRSRPLVLRLNILRALNPDNLLQSGQELLPDIVRVECT
jgi:hypothetical protein